MSEFSIDITLEDDEFEKVVQAQIQKIANSEYRFNQDTREALVEGYFDVVKCRQAIKLRNIACFVPTQDLSEQVKIETFQVLDKHLQLLSGKFIAIIKHRFELDLCQFEPRPMYENAVTVELTVNISSENTAPSTSNQLPRKFEQVEKRRELLEQCIRCKGPIYWCPLCLIIHGVEHVLPPKHFLPKLNYLPDPSNVSHLSTIQGATSKII